jgi:hypothetical protein
MRTTVTLDPDVDAKLREVARERGVSFKVALNEAVRSGTRPEVPGQRSFCMPTRSLGVRPGVNLDKAVQLAGEWEDEELSRRSRRAVDSW